MLSLLLSLSLLAASQDVFVPPVPLGIRTDVKAYVPKRPIPFPDEHERWTRTSTPHFDVISSTTAAQTESIASGLETLGAALTQLAAVKPAARATVFVFARRDESQPYFDLLLQRENSPATGVYVRHRDGGTMFIDASRPHRFERTAMHELVHDLLRQNDLVPPLWLEEGLAEYYGSADVQEDRVIVGLPIPEHVSLLRRGVPMSADELFAVTIDSDIAATPQFYAQSWAAVSWLMRTDRESFWPFLRDVAQGTTVAHALETHYGKALRFESGGQAILPVPRNESSGGQAILPVPVPVPGPHEGQAGLPVLHRATLLYELGRFLSHVAGAETEAQRHYREALRIDPKHARSLAALGDYDAALAADPQDPDIHLQYAETLLKTAIGQFAGVFEPESADVAGFRKARTLAQRALDLGGDEARARADLGASYLVEGDVAEGIAHLERAHALAPQRMDVALNLYAMYLRHGERAKADALFAASFANAREKQVAFAARNVLLASETARANALAKSGKLEEAAVVVRALAAATPDGMARRELEQQAAQLESVAMVNRHIVRYNEAVAYSNAGRKREALAILDALLREATDPLVIRDAKRLHAELRKK